MCTLTWRFDPRGGYTLLFNRDELRTRKKALPPSIKQTAKGITYLSPTDSDAGGTWLAVNQFGITFCLLNFYAAEKNPSEVIHSRGEVIVKLADASSIAECEKHLRALDLSVYQGFELVVVHNDAKHWRWDTKTLVETDASLPITSSSYKTLNMQNERVRYFKAQIDPSCIESLKAFHSCHLDDSGQLMEDTLDPSMIVNSVCIHRERSATVSQCIVNVSGFEASIDYLDGSPCSVERVLHSSLIRRQVA